MKQKVSNKRKKAINKWLNSSDKDWDCPFHPTFKFPNSCPFCKSWFPRIKIAGDLESACPCAKYSLAHVIRTAKIMLK